MVEFINKYTGSTMLVHESRVAEYEAKGHVRAGVVIADVEAVEIKAEAEAPAVEKPKVRKSSSRRKDPKEW